MKALIGTLLLLLSFHLQAEQEMRYYDVEVVIFENLDPQAKQAENWPLQVNMELPEKTIELGQPVISSWLPAEADKRLSYRLLPASQFRLKEEVDKLTESEKYRMIFHTAWRQPGLDKNTSLPVHFKRTIPPAPPLQQTPDTESDYASEAEASTEDNTPYELEGLLRVTLARYLRLEGEMTYKKKPLEVSDTENPFAVLDNEDQLQAKQGVIHFKQVRRRIRSKELHYLDHPVLGVLLKITPYQPGNK